MSRKTLAAIAAAIFVVVLLSACGTKTITQTRTLVTHLTATFTTPEPLTATVPAPSCPPGQATMNCVLATLPAPPRLFGLAPASVYGLDFGWGGVSATAAKNAGARFGASYLSNDGTKNWTRALVDAYHAAGLKTVAVWESTATRSEEGYAAGVTDAHLASAQAAALGNTARPIIFAVDCDCAGSSILGYFQGVHAVLGARDDAYGGYDQVAYLHSHRVVGPENWQTYAWSGGRWLPASIAPLEQYLNGGLFDNDRALGPAYGQWPYSAPKPKPEYSGAQIAKWRRGYTASLKVYRAKGCPTLRQRYLWFGRRVKGKLHAKHLAAYRTNRRLYLARHCGLFAQRTVYFRGRLIAAGRTL